MPKRTPKGTTRSNMFLDSISEQEYHQGDSWASIEVVRVARVRAERSRWTVDKGECSSETKPGTDRGRPQGRAQKCQASPALRPGYTATPRGLAHSRHSLCTPRGYTHRQPHTHSAVLDPRRLVLSWLPTCPPHGRVHLPGRFSATRNRQRHEKRLK